MQPREPRFALFQSQPEPLPAEAVARALTALPADPADPTRDARRIARNAYGVPLDGLPRAAAEAAQAAFAQAGIACELGEQAWLAPLALTVTRRLRLEPEALVVLDLYGRATRITWDDVLLIACAELPDESPRPEPGAAEAGRAARDPEALALAVLGDAQAPQHTRAVLDLVVRGPVRRYRIEANAFDYGCLGERKEPSAARNFRKLVQQLAERAPGARHNQGATALLTLDALHRYDGEALLEREMGYWLWKLHGGELARCERAPAPAATAPALDPALLLGAPRARTGFGRDVRLLRALLLLGSLAVLGWLLLLLHRMAASNLAPIP